MELGSLAGWLGVVAWEADSGSGLRVLYEVGPVPKLGRGLCVEKKHLPPAPASLAGRVVKARG